MNRPMKQDWLEIDFGEPTEFRRMELAIYDDHGGVQVPQNTKFKLGRKTSGRRFSGLVRRTQQRCSQWNIVRFAPVQSNKVRIVFHQQRSGSSGVTEVTCGMINEFLK